MAIAFLTLAGLLLCANAIVSKRVLSAHAWTPLQNAMQVGLIWLVPAIGAVLMYALLREEGAHRPHPKWQELGLDPSGGYIDHNVPISGPFDGPSDVGGGSSD